MIYFATEIKTIKNGKRSLHNKTKAAFIYG